MLSPRLSSADPRERHRGLSHHTLTVLELLLRRSRSRCRRASEARIAAALAEAPRRRHRLRAAPADLDGYAAVRAAGADDGPQHRRGPTLLRRPARRRGGARGRRLAPQGIGAARENLPAWRSR